MKIDTHCNTDLVVDTNALSHAEQPSNVYSASAVSFLKWLKDSDHVRWTLDDQGKSAPDLSTSVLASEYYATLAPQGLSLVIFTTCLALKRVVFAPRPNAAVRKSIRQLVPRNTNDQAILGAAAGSADKLLVSNDFDDFPPDVRAAALTQLQVRLLDTAEAVS